MPDPSLTARLQRSIAECEPASAAGAALLTRYLEVASFEGSRATQETELASLRELCRIVEQTPFETISIASLSAAADAEGASATRALRRRRVVGRLIRILQQRGELPSNRDLTASRGLERELAATPEQGRQLLRRWLARRSRHVGWFELRQEARRLRRLEELIVLYPDAEPTDLFGLWLRALVRPIVNCDCAPLTRAADPTRCPHCGATAETHGMRSSPAAAKQDRIRSLGRKYLAFRALSVPRDQR